MKTYTEKQLYEILQKHKLWLDGRDGGERADLSHANLSKADLSDADLHCANLSNANLSSVDLRYANLSRTDLRHANLHCANLGCADLRHADLGYANLRDADLSYADLGYADLSGANLLATGNMVNVKSVQADTWRIAYTHDILQIGCRRHPIAKWWAFDDEEIERMDSQALEWWAVWKPILQAMIAASPAEPTGFVEKDQAQGE